MLLEKNKKNRKKKRIKEKHKLTAVLDAKTESERARESERGRVLAEKEIIKKDREK